MDSDSGDTQNTNIQSVDNTFCSYWQWRKYYVELLIHEFRSIMIVKSIQRWIQVSVPAAAVLLLAALLRQFSSDILLFSIDNSG